MYISDETDEIRASSLIFMFPIDTVRQSKVGKAKNKLAKTPGPQRSKTRN